MQRMYVSGISDSSMAGNRWITQNRLLIMAMGTKIMEFIIDEESGEKILQCTFC